MKAEMKMFASRPRPNPAFKKAQWLPMVAAVIGDRPTSCRPFGSSVERQGVVARTSIGESNTRDLIGSE
jgi:hypothetical protein